MSSISSLSSDVLVEILCYTPPSDIAMNCGMVCKEWNIVTKEIALWQKIAIMFDIETTGTTAKDVETCVRNCLLNRSVVISTKEKLKKKITNYFSNILEGETRALFYCSASNPKAFGFYIKTKNLRVIKQLRKEHGMKAVQEIFPTLKGLTITGKGEADHVDRGTSILSTPTGESVATQNLTHTIELEYFNNSTN